MSLCPSFCSNSPFISSVYEGWIVFAQAEVLKCEFCFAQEYFSPIFGMILDNSLIEGTNMRLWGKAIALSVGVGVGVGLGCWVDV
ncbi:hypothetical protein BEN30_04815 [Magnetovibrio blakemorei]|uniref:Uncharacterized protein n=1 Tax=Magnetovibrio blakemorei TaxID=28181 RepID=A0A1E5QAM3_9PROT|nr:hypothetical protein BEN30_04815 [Magnetovibrio blakemorei]